MQQQGSQAAHKSTEVAAEQAAKGSAAVGLKQCRRTHQCHFVYSASSVAFMQQQCLLSNTAAIQETQCYGGCSAAAGQPGRPKSTEVAAEQAAKDGAAVGLLMLMPKDLTTTLFLMQGGNCLNV